MIYPLDFFYCNDKDRWRIYANTLKCTYLEFVRRSVPQVHVHHCVLRRPRQVRKRRGQLRNASGECDSPSGFRQLDSGQSLLMSTCNSPVE